MRKAGDDTIRVLGNHQRDMEANLARLSEFSASAETASAAEAEQFFRQIAGEPSEALQRFSPKAGTFFVAVQSALRAVPSEYASPSRVHCLLCLAQFHYLIGQPLNGVEPATDGTSCARKIEEIGRESCRGRV